MMAEMKIPRVMIAAPGSGSGKTMITCGLLELLRCEGHPVHKSCENKRISGVERSDRS